MAKKENNLYLGVSEPQQVDAFMQQLNHPLKAVVEFLRKEILAAHPGVAEGIYWNAPTFYYSGKMPAFDPKTYKRYVCGFVFNRQDCIRMVFLHAAPHAKQFAILEGEFKDDRKLLVCHSLDEARKKAPELKKLIKVLINDMA